MRRNQRMATARMLAYQGYDDLVRAVEHSAPLRRIDRLTARSIRAWNDAARAHHGDTWRRVAIWMSRMLSRGVLRSGAPIPERLCESWRIADVTWIQYLYRIGMPHYWCEPAVLIDGTVWHPGNGQSYWTRGGRVGPRRQIFGGRDRTMEFEGRAAT